MTLNGSYISPKQHFDNMEDFKVKETTELFQNYKEFSSDNT